MRMVRAFVGIGSVDTVVAPDSALVGVAGPVATPCTSTWYTTYDVSVSSFAKIALIQAMPRDRVDTSTRSLPFTTTMSCTKSAPGRALHLAKGSIY